MPRTPYTDQKYRSLPEGFKVLRAPGYEYPAFHGTEGTELVNLVTQLLENDWRPRAEVRRRQLLQLRCLLKFAAQESAFYRERIQAAGLDPGAMENLEQFRSLPLLGRRDLQDSFEKVKSRRLPASTESQSELSTSGSSGSPVRILTTNISALMWHACNLRDLVWAGIDPHRTLAALRHSDKEVEQAHTPEGTHLRGWGGKLARCFETGESYLMDVGMDPEVQLAFLQRSKPTYILSYPTNLELLAHIVKERGIDFPELEVVQCISEILRPGVRRGIEEAFNARVVDLYSCVEVGYIASQCPSGDGYHVHEENVLVEIIDDDGEPVTAGESGRLVVTSLVNYATPLIRYEVGDYAMLAEEPCSCGRGLMKLKEIVGRQRGQLLLPDGTVKFSSQLSTALRDVGKIRQFQVIQHERDHVEVLIVPMDGFGELQKETIVKAFREYLGFPIRVDFTLVEAIERTAAGKYLDFVCRAS